MFFSFFFIFFSIYLLFGCSMFGFLPTSERGQETPTFWPLLPCPEEFEELGEEWMVGRKDGKIEGKEEGEKKEKGRVLLSGTVWILGLFYCSIYREYCYSQRVFFRLSFLKYLAELFSWICIFTKFLFKFLSYTMNIAMCVL